ncbi:MAG: L-tyrosine/L-tryptophan isonitrile synthase family protein [Planctomycetes bacterium]|nr:L-tyrosine/L-tryptophan isonitrile synthase family protein [Planctomycetota bacterium]
MSTRLTSGATVQGAAIARSPALREAKALLLAGHDLPRATERMLADRERSAIIDEIAAIRRAAADRLARRAALAGGKVAGILRILKASATFRSRTRFDDAAAMEGATTVVERLVREGRPIVLALPLGGGKAPNPVKTGWRFLPDASEWVAWSLLAAMADAVSEVHPPGASVLVIPDAPLHTADLAFAAAEASAHQRQAALDLAALQLQERVRIAEVLAELPDRWPDEVRLRAEEARRRLRVDPGFAAAAGEQVQSLLFTVNLRSGAPSLEEAVLLSAVLAGDVIGVDEAIMDRASHVREWVEGTAPHYVGVNHALRSLDLPGLLTQRATGSPLHVRLTAHAKPGEPQPLLVPAGSWARPGLLPLHSVALRYLGRGRFRHASAFELEALMAGATAVVARDGRFLYH